METPPLNTPYKKSNNLIELPKLLKNRLEELEEAGEFTLWLADLNKHVFSFKEDLQSYRQTLVNILGIKQVSNPVKDMFSNKKIGNLVAKELGLSLNIGGSKPKGHNQEFLDEPDQETQQLKFQSRLEENCAKILKVLGEGSGSGVEFISERLKNDVVEGENCCTEDMWSIGETLKNLNTTLNLEK